MIRFSSLLLPCLAFAAACDDSPVTPIDDEHATLTVDASEAWAFVALGETAAIRSVSDPATSSEWDIAFNATRVMLNGGAAGPGGVAGYCVCQNEGATDAQVRAMTAAGEAADFEAVSLADVPASESEWQSDALDAAIIGWYAYDMQTHQVSAVPTRVWRVRGTGEAPEFAKLHVTALEDATQAGARVTIEYAVQPSAGAAFGPVQSATLDGLGGPVYFDFATGIVTAADAWDIALDGYTIRVNSGVSGSGSAGAVLSEVSFDALTDASDAPAQVYRADAFGGAFTAHPYYRYNLDGNHTIFPTFNVYLIRRGTTIYKIQVTSYYDTAGQDRRITFRYAPLES